MFARATIVGFAAATAACFTLAGAAAQGTPDYAALIAAPDRSAADRATDARRDPLKLLAFIGARPGMKILDLGAGGGYSTELMARAVGPNGVVYGQNPPNFSERATAAFEARTKTPAANPSSACRVRSTTRCLRTLATSISSPFCSSITTPPTWASIAPR
jgi:predicted methyltransferase